MEYKDESEKIPEDAVLPGFRFHPTDEELVAFYLKRKIQHKSLPIELIHQVDIYKYDPWDLPKVASMGEKEWYFYCPRDRKYRNSARPNRVTGAGFWKATGTDRPIYASDHETKCIGLKKSLVFYRGRAAKGIKTDWMMHEFRLPSVSDPTSPAKKFSEKCIPASECWAICRIFKKTNSMAQRALSQSWAAQLHEVHTPNMFEQEINCVQFSPGNFSSVAPIEFTSNDLHACKLSSSSHEIQSYKPIDQFLPNIPLILYNNELSEGSELEDFKASEDQFNDFTVSFSQEVHGNIVGDEEDISKRKLTDHNHTGATLDMGYPFSLYPKNVHEVWKEAGMPWDSSPSTSDMSITYSAENARLLNP